MTGFFSEFDRKSGFTLVNIKGFQEGKDSVVYAVGRRGNGAAILKYSADGTFLWAKTFAPKSDNKDLKETAFEIAQMYIGKSVQYVIASASAKHYHLSSIDLQGNDGWSFDLPSSSAKKPALLSSGHRGESLTFVYCNDSDENSLNILEFESTGNLLKVKTPILDFFKGANIVLSALEIINGTMVIAGNFSSDNTSKSAAGFFLKLDHSALSGGLRIIPNLRIDDFVAGPKDNLFAVAYEEKLSRAALTQMDVGTGVLWPNKPEYWIVPNSENSQNVICRADDGYRLSNFGRRDSYIHALAPDLSAAQLALWSKRITYGEKWIAFDRLHFQPMTGRITCTSTAANIFGFIAPDFDLCVAKPVEPAKFEAVELDSEDEKIALQLEKPDAEKRTPDWGGFEIKTRKVCPDEPQKPGVEITLDDGTLLQSPHLYLQAAGSDGSDSTHGNHLRWT